MDLIGSGAKWIWQHDNPDVMNQYVYFRKEISVSGQIESVKIDISASNSYQLYINGRFIGRGPAPCNPDHQYYDTHFYNDLKPGDRLCFAVVAYCIGEESQMVTQQNKGIPAFITAITSCYSDGSVEEIVSDENWRTIISPSYFTDQSGIFPSGMRISMWGGYKEVFLAAKEPSDWKVNGFDDSGWTNAVIVPKAEEYFRHLIPRDIPFLHTETIFPESVIQIEKNLGEIVNESSLLAGSHSYAVVHADKPGSFPAVILDFGKEVVGYPEVILAGFTGGSMSLWYGESLDLQRVDSLIMDRGGDEVHGAGSGEIVYTPYHRRAFRYLKLCFNACEEHVYIKSVKLNLVHYPYIEAGSFECSSTLLNRIWEISVYTAKLATQNHFEDSVWREAMQWVGDSRVISLVNYWVFGDKAIVRKMIRQFFIIQKEDGSIPAAGPQTTTILLPDFCAYFVMIVYEYYFYTADLEFIREVYQPLKRLMDWFEAQEAEDGLFEKADRAGWWCFVDWADLDKRDKVTAVNCLYYKALQDFVKLVDLINPDDAVRYVNKACRLRETINRKMFNGQKGLYVDCITGEEPSERFSQQSNIIAVYCGVAPENEIREIIRKLYEYSDLEVVKGAFLMSFVAETLYNNGYAQKATAIIEDFWGEMKKRGATTWWETFDRSTSGVSAPYAFTRNTPTYLTEYIPVSHCHGWGAGPAFVLMKNILGIKPVKPGFKEIIFEPYTEGLTFCRGAIPTIYGEIKVEWKKGANGEIIRHIEKPDEIVVVMR